jgi:cellulose synthase/poly-beta-1,6-N-acetylglucosamine synthase-like glycosyltransferase
MKKNQKRLSLNDILFWFSISSILYTYFGYPLLITILAKRKPKKTYIPVSTLNVSLVIAAYNEELVIGEKINNCLQLDYPKNNLQIIVVSDGSDDQTPNIVQKYANQGIELLHSPLRRGKMAAINRAVPYSTGDIIIFSDANNLYQPDTIKNLVAPFVDPRIGATSGAKIIQMDGSSLGESEGFYWKYESFIKEQESRLNSCTGVAGEILAIRRQAFASPPDEIINDDFYMAMQVLKQGYRIAYVPQAKSIERVSASAKHEITRRKRIIAGRYQAMFMAGKLLPIKRPVLVWQIISHKFLRPLVPFSMIIAIFTNILGVLRKDKSTHEKKIFWNLNSISGKLTLLAQFMFYLLAWMAGKIDHRSQSSSIKRIVYIPKFLVDSNIAALQGFIEYLKGQQTHLWERIPRQQDP